MQDFFTGRKMVTVITQEHWWYDYCGLYMTEFWINCYWMENLALKSSALTVNGTSFEEKICCDGKKYERKEFEIGVVAAVESSSRCDVEIVEEMVSHWSRMSNQLYGDTMKRIRVWKASSQLLFYGLNGISLSDWGWSLAQRLLRKRKENQIIIETRSDKSKSKCIINREHVIS